MGEHVCHDRRSHVVLLDLGESDFRVAVKTKLQFDLEEEQECLCL